MAATGAAPAPEPVHAWERFERTWVAMFHLALGVPTVVALAGAGAAPLRWALILAGAAIVAGARHLATRALAGVEEESPRHLGVGLVWAAATLAAMVLLVDTEEAFFFALYGLFPQAFVLLPRNWALGFSAALVPVVLIGAKGPSVLGDAAVSIVGSALLAPAIGLSVTAISRQSEQRQRAIVALQAAQDEAEALFRTSLAVSRARTVDEVVAALGESLAARGATRVSLDVGAEPVAAWSAQADAEGPGTARFEVSVPGEEGGRVSLRVTGAPLTAESRRSLETLATSCGLALANFRLVERARHTGVLEERGRLAREIHDTLAQGFVSVLTQLEAAGELLGEAPAEVRQRVERARAIARSSLGEARRSVEALRPGPLEAAGLAQAIERVVARWSADSGVAATATVTGPPQPLPASTEVTVLRAAQEALANVARHARATEVSVTLSFLGDAVVLDVHDDGRGFDPAASPNGSGGGFGLEALRQRVDGSGGYFGLETAPGAGTTVTVHVPLAAERLP